MLGLWMTRGPEARAVSGGRGPRRPAKESHHHRSNGSIPFLSKKTMQTDVPFFPQKSGPRDRSPGSLTHVASRLPGSCPEPTPVLHTQP